MSQESAYDELKKIQASTTFKLKPTKFLKKEFRDLSGNVVPFVLRYYQAIGVYTLMCVPRMVLGDATGIGKTAQVIGAMCYLWEYGEANNKVIVVCPKSATHQWASEIKKFTEGVTAFVVPKEPKQRADFYKKWLAHEGPSVLILGYAILARDWDAGAKFVEDTKTKKKVSYTPGLLEDLLRGREDIVVVYDECTAFKSEKTKNWDVCSRLSRLSKRVYGLTATLLKNKLEEGFSIYKVLVPDLFGSKTSFLNEYAVTRLQKVGFGKQIPIIVGYKNIDRFRKTIDPFFLGRAKHMVSSELPTLITKEVNCTLNKLEDTKYEEALQGVLRLGNGEVKDYEETTALSSLIYCQMTVDSLTLLKFKENQDVLVELDFEEELNVGSMGSKETCLVDLIMEELMDEKVIIYTRFASLVPRLQHILARECEIKSVAITGSVSDKNRRLYQEQFQDINSDVNVIFITDAGSEALNLQMASAMIFYDAPWSWGTYVQLLGRPIRIGSPNQSVLCYHLVAERPKEKGEDRQTIDKLVLKTLGKKKSLIDKVLGESAVGALNFSETESLSGINELIAELQKTAKNGKK